MPWSCHRLECRSDDKDVWVDWMAGENSSAPTPTERWILMCCPSTDWINNYTHGSVDKRAWVRGDCLFDTIWEMASGQSTRDAVEMAVRSLLDWTVFTQVNCCEGDDMSALHSSFNARHERDSKWASQIRWRQIYLRFAQENAVSETATNGNFRDVVNVG